MDGSTARRNTAGLPSLSADAMAPNTSINSCRVSARAKVDANSKSERRSMGSRTIAGVDPDVAIGQVAGPETRGAFSFSAKSEPDFAFLRLELLLQRRFGERGSQSSPADRRALKIDIGLGRIKRHAGVSCRAEDASPVGVGAGHGSLDQGRVGHGPRDLGRRAIV